MKHLIKIQTVEHGTLSCIHGGRDGQYAEAGTTIVLDWQPSAGWGLQEAHIIDGAGNVTQINLAAKTFTMPDSPITIVGTFKRFGVQDWTEGHNPHVGAAFVVGIHGEPVPQGGNLVSIGSFANNDLPTLNGFDDAGKMAFSTTLRQYITWDGYGWTMLDGTPITPRYLRVVSSSNFAFCIETVKGTPSVPEDWSLEYSSNGGRDWNTYTIALSGNENKLTGDVLFRGNNKTAFYFDDGTNGGFLNFYSEGPAELSGDLTSLLNNFGGNVALTPNAFRKMFEFAVYITSAPNLPSTTLGDSCYCEMFSGCNALLHAPELPATTLEPRCYQGMFLNCVGLVSAPELPATVLANSCYLQMFKGCSALVSAPELKAEVAATRCYNAMFYGCEGLTNVPFIHITTPATACFGDMFNGCVAVPSYHFATLNNSTNTFSNNNACAEFVIDDETPPTIASSTISGLKNSCAIFVPSKAVDDYKEKQYWSSRAQYIQAKP